MKALPVYMPLTCNHFVPDSPYSCAHDLLGSLVLGILVCAVHKFCSKFETPLHNSYSRCTCTCSSMGTEHANTCVPSQFRTDMSPRLLNNLAWLLTTCGAMTAMHNALMYESGSWELKDMTSCSACSTKYVASSALGQGMAYYTGNELRITIMRLISILMSWWGGGVIDLNVLMVRGMMCMRIPSISRVRFLLASKITFSLFLPLHVFRFASICRCLTE